MKKPLEDSASSGLRKEAWALLLIYLALAFVPLLTGFACHGMP